MTVDGGVEAGFGGVADAFRRNFDARSEIGAEVAVYTGGGSSSIWQPELTRSGTVRSRARR